MGKFVRCKYANFKRYEKVIVIYLSVLLLISLIFVFSMGMAKKSTNSNSASAVMEMSRKEIIKGDNLHTRLPMASTTKIMTAYIACKSGKLDDIVTITKDMVGVEGSSIYLAEGEKYKLIDLVYGLMLRSGNDSAEAIAKFLSGSIENFANKMNEEVAKLGLKNTHFVNPHGLHDDNHYTSAYDLAYITATALQNEKFAEICATKSYKFSLTSGENKCYFNKNKLLNMYDGCIGVKTGYTKKAGRCLVSACDKNGVKIVSVVLNRYDMWNESMQNLDLGTKNAKKIQLVRKNNVFATVKSKNGQLLNLACNKEIDYVILKNEKINLTYEIKLYDNLPKNVNKNEIVGEILFFNDKCLLFKEKIYNI